MIEKLIDIKNVGKFSKLNLKNGTWNGVFKKNNIIYAPNGRGKTTLSLIFQSFQGDPELLQRKKTFADLQSSDAKQLVSLMVGGKNVKYEGDRWNSPVNDVEVFNIHFIESTLFTGSSQLRHNRLNLFKYLSDDAVLKMKVQVDGYIDKRNELNKAIKKIRSQIRAGRIGRDEQSGLLEPLILERESVQRQLALGHKELGVYAQQMFQDFVPIANGFLENFSESMRLEKISKELNQQTTFYLKFGSNRVTFGSNPDGHEFRYTLSEGDKNAFAISIFLAKLSISSNLRDKTVVFDDPLTSLDSGRRYLTIKELSRLSAKVGQLIVLTHDASFASELEREIRQDSLSLELFSQDNQSWLSERDHEGENVTGFFRDLKRLTDYQIKRSGSNSECRDVIRCLRPTLEGFVRVKYFDRIAKKEWLGDFIGTIRNASGNDELMRLQDTRIYNDLVDVNDYSKGFHHSSPEELEPAISEGELAKMVDKTLRLIKQL